jgi:hypothetical protein
VVRGLAVAAIPGCLGELQCHIDVELSLPKDRQITAAGWPQYCMYVPWFCNNLCACLYAYTRLYVSVGTSAR